jgi:queuine tRNA-ribosyltransferase
MMRAVESAGPGLPKNKPRYAMDCTPPQLLEMIARGMDMFDCVADAPGAQWNGVHRHRHN